MSSPAAMLSRTADWRSGQFVPEPRHPPMEARRPSEGLDFFGSQFGTPPVGKTTGIRTTQVDPVIAAKAYMNLDTTRRQAIHKREKYHCTVPPAKLARRSSLKIVQDTSGCGTGELAALPVSADLYMNTEFQIPSPCPPNPNDAWTVVSCEPSSFQGSASRGDRIGYVQSPTAQLAKDKEASVEFHPSALHALEKSSNRPRQNAGDSPEQHRHAPNRSKAGSSRQSRTPVSSQKVSSTAQSKDSHPSGSHNNRNGYHDDGHETNRDQSSPPSHGTAPLESSTRQLLHCFFYAADPVKFKKCSERKLTSVSAVKQHLERRHKKPEFYCPICCETFDDDDASDTHIRTKSCEESPNRFRDKIKATVWARIKVKRKGETPSDWWQATFKLLFPDHKLSRSPHTDNTTIQRQTPSLTPCGASNQAYRPTDSIDPSVLVLNSMSLGYPQRTGLPHPVPPQNRRMSSPDDTRGDMTIYQGDPNDWCSPSNQDDASIFNNHLDSEMPDALIPLSQQLGWQGEGGTAYSLYGELSDDDCDYDDDDDEMHE